MAPVEIGGQLHLVDRDEIDVDVARHRLDRRDPVARRIRLDLLLAGHQRDIFGADPLDDAVVDFARQQPQRQADHAVREGQHPLNGVMRLARVGRPQHRTHARVPRLGAAAHRRSR